MYSTVTLIDIAFCLHLAEVNQLCRKLFLLSLWQTKGLGSGCLCQPAFDEYSFLDGLSYILLDGLTVFIQTDVVISGHVWDMH
jgi:hypothetical protein